MPCKDCPIKGTEYCHKVNPMAKKYTRAKKNELREAIDKEQTMAKYKDFEYEEFSDGRVRSTFPNIGQMLFNSMDEFKAYVDGYHYTQESFKMIETELRNAVERHPEFCSAIIDPASSKSWIETERQIKLRNECGPEYADCILMEEMAEAFAAYEQGDKAHCIQELAQCGAVILRIMETIEKEMEEKHD